MASIPLPMIPRDILRTCVHCGLCLPTCPTYDVLGDERDSPRGRLFQMKSVADGVVPLDDPSLRLHIGRCLDCRACETVCPSGVQYGHALEAIRSAMPATSGKERLARSLILNGVFASPQLLDAAGASLRLYSKLGLGRAARQLGVFKVLPSRLGAMEAMLPAAQPASPLPMLLLAQGTRVARVGLITGCVMKGLFGATNAATARVLAVNGCEVVIPKVQGCCGALHGHAGDRQAARTLARAMIDAFPDDLDAVIINAAGCGSALKDYGHLLADDPVYAARATRFSGKVRDVSEWLVGIGIRPPQRSLNACVTYQDACHLRHAQRIKAQPRALLQAIPGLQLVELAGSEDCCGSAGIYNITQPELAMQLLEQKMDRVTATGARILAVGNPGCAIQIKYGARMRGIDLRVAHPVDLLAWAYS